MGQGGGLVLVPGGNAIQWGLRGANRSHPNQDKHKAPSSTPPRPLSLQHAGRTFLDSIVNHHQAAGEAMVPMVHFPDLILTFCRDKGWIWGRVGALCLSLVATRSSGDCVEQTGRTPTRTSTRPPHPLHPAPCPYRTLGRKHLTG